MVGGCSREEYIPPLLLERNNFEEAGGALPDDLRDKGGGLREVNCPEWMESAGGDSARPSCDMMGVLSLE
jgi:hypothetical protein